MKKASFILFSGISLLSLTACVAGKYTVPTLKDELNYVEQDKYEVDKEWWKQYGDEELNRIVEIALERNPDYLKAAINIERENYSVQKKGMDLFPTVSSGTISASSKRSISTHDKYHKTFSGEGGLKYELDLFGKIRDAYSAEEFELMATVMDKDAAELVLVNSVIDLFFNLEYLHNAIILTKENIDSYENIHAIAKDKNESGKIDNLEVVQASKSLISEKNKLLELEMKFRENENTLRNILDYRAGEDLKIKYSDILDHNDLDVDLDVPIYVLANRPDLKASQYRVEKAFRNLKAEDKSWYPSIKLNGVISSSSDKFEKAFSFPYILGSISFNLPFLDWTRVYSDIKISEADYKSTVISFKDTLNRAVNEVAYYYFAYINTKTVFGNIINNYENTKKITEYYNNRYDMGKAELKDLLEAMNSENTLRKEMLQQKYQILKFENYIYKSLAGRYVKTSK